MNQTYPPLTKTISTTFFEMPFDFEAQISIYGEVLKASSLFLQLPLQAQQLSLGENWKNVVDLLKAYEQLIHYKVPLALTGFLKEAVYLEIKDEIRKKQKEAGLDLVFYPDQVKSEWVQELYQNTPKVWLISERLKCNELLLIGQMLSSQIDEETKNIIISKYLMKQSNPSNLWSEIIRTAFPLFQSNQLISAAYKTLGKLKNDDNKAYLLKCFESDSKKSHQPLIVDVLSNYRDGDVYAIMLNHTQNLDQNGGMVLAKIIDFLAPFKSRQVEALMIEVIMSFDERYVTRAKSVACQNLHFYKSEENKQMLKDALAKKEYKSIHEAILNAMLHYPEEDIYQCVLSYMKNLSYRKYREDWLKFLGQYPIPTTTALMWKIMKQAENTYLIPIAFDYLKKQSFSEKVILTNLNLNPVNQFEDCLIVLKIYENIDNAALIPSPKQLMRYLNNHSDRVKNPYDHAIHSLSFIFIKYHSEQLLELVLRLLYHKNEILCLTGISIIEKKIKEDKMEHPFDDIQIHERLIELYEDADERVQNQAVYISSDFFLNIQIPDIVDALVSKLASLHKDIWRIHLGLERLWFRYMEDKQLKSYYQYLLEHEDKRFSDNENIKLAIAKSSKWFLKPEVCQRLEKSKETPSKQLLDFFRKKEVHIGAFPKGCNYANYLYFQNKYIQQIYDAFPAGAIYQP